MSSIDEYRLLTDPDGRRRHVEDGFFVVEGYVALDKAIESGHEVRSLLLAESRVDRIRLLVDELRARGVPVYVVPKSELEGYTGYRAHRGVLASFTRPAPPSLVELAASSSRLVVLEGLNDYENVGAIARAARAFRFDAMVLDPRCTDEHSRRSVRVSMGQILYLPVVRADHTWPAQLDVLHAAGFETWAMTPADDADDLWSVPVPEKVAIVVGAEGPGLDAATMRATTRRVRIPIDPAVDSLNVGHAAAVTMSALQRPLTPPVLPNS